MSTAFAKKLNKTASRHPTNVKVTLADGSTRQVSEAAYCNVRLGNVQHSLKFLIMPQTFEDVVLGLSFLQAFQATISCAGHQVTCRRPDDLSTQRSPVNPSQSHHAAWADGYEKIEVKTANGDPQLPLTPDVTHCYDLTALTTEPPSGNLPQISHVGVDENNASNTKVTREPESDQTATQAVHGNAYPTSDNRPEPYARELHRNLQHTHANDTSESEPQISKEQVAIAEFLARELPRFQQVTGRTHIGEHRIRMLDEQPIKIRYSSRNPKMQQIVDSEVDKLL